MRDVLRLRDKLLTLKMFCSPLDSATIRAGHGYDVHLDENTFNKSICCLLTDEGKESIEKIVTFGLTLYG